MPTNLDYSSTDALPSVIPVFPLTAALLLPRGQMPLNIFEPRYLQMIDDALKSGHRMIGMIQPKGAVSSLSGEDHDDQPDLCAIGCMGRITAFQETGDGRYLMTLTGICRYRIAEELDVITPYRQCRVETEPFARDLDPETGSDAVDREKLLETFRAYLDANNLEADWDSVEDAHNEALVNALSMMSPYGPREKQALLEAPDLKARADMLVAMTEMVLRTGDVPQSEQLQ